MAPDEFFGNENEKSLRVSTISAASVLARLMRDRVENMSGEMKLTPKLTPGAHPASPAQPSPPLPSSSAQLVAELLQPSSLSLYFQPVVFAVIHCSLVLYSLSRVQCYHFLSLCARILLPTHTDALSQVFFSFFPNFLCSASPASSSPLPRLLSSSGANHGCIGTSPFIMPTPVRSEESVQAGESVC